MAGRALRVERLAVNRRLRLILEIVGIIFGVALIAYPYVSDYLEKQYQAQVVVTQETAVSGSESTVDLESERQKALDYNDRLSKGRVQVTDPFDAVDAGADNEEYASLMNVAGDGVMGTVVIPKINAKIPIYHTTEDDVLQKGVGHMETTSLPMGGASSHAVLAGHSGLPSVRIFDDLDQLEVGDYFVVQVLGEDHAYRVTSIETVLPDETESLSVQDGKDLVTLVTCTPYGINTHRLLVHGERCELPAEWTDGDDQNISTTPTPSRALLPFTLLGVAVALGIVLGLALRRRSKRRGHSKGGAAGKGRRRPADGRLLGPVGSVDARPGQAVGMLDARGYSHGGERAGGRVGGQVPGASYPANGDVQAYARQVYGTGGRADVKTYRQHKAHKANQPIRRSMYSRRRGGKHFK